MSARTDPMYFETAGRDVLLMRLLLDLTNLGGEHDGSVGLRHLLDRCVEVLPGAEASLILTDAPGTLVAAASTTERAQVLAKSQIDAGEGPAIESIQRGERVLDQRLYRDAQWPSCAPTARAVGYVVLHGIPLARRGEVIGAVTMGDAQERNLTPRQAMVLQAIAEAAAIGILHERSLRRSTLVTQQLEGALKSRVLIEQAKGAMSERLGISVDEAFELLRYHARSGNQRLDLVATEALSHAITEEELRRGRNRRTRSKVS